jgi:hypothetical protein
VIGWALAAQIAIVANGPSAATVCAPIELTAAARAPGPVAPRLELAAGSTLQLLRARLVSRVERDGSGATSSITEGSFLVATPATGRVAFPPFVATVGAAQARASAAPIEVRPTTDDQPIVLVRATLDAGSGRSADSVFVGQQMDYVVDVQLNAEARQRLRRNPTFFPPEMPAVLAYDLPTPGPVARAGRHCFETLSYRRALFPLFPGSSVIPPATLTYSLPVSTSFFSREESFELHTDSVRFTAAEPPTEGRPSDFLGAVGTLRAALRADATSARMGDPVVVTLRLDGTGNVKLLPRPVITVDWAAIALGDERVGVDTSAARVRGWKEFDWLLTPRRAGRLDVGAIRYPYFDVDARRYELAATDSLPLAVSAATLASADTSGVARLPIRHQLDDERPPDLPAHGWYWLALLVAPVPVSLRRLRARRRRRAAAHSPSRRLRTLAASRAAPAPRELRRLYLDALRERVPALAGATSPAPFGRALRHAGVTDATAHAAELLLDRLDAAAFSSAGATEPALVAQAAAVVAAVHGQAVRPSLPTLRAVPMILALVVGARLLAMPAAVSQSFADGVRAYERGDLADAQRLFARVAARAPRAVDGWMNYGTAAWMRGDTAHAALGWQRALRLDPLNGEARERLAQVQPPLIGAPGYVAPIPVNAVALAALILWVGGWLALALPASVRPRHTRALAGGGLVVAIVLLGTALELAERSGVRTLGAIRAGRTLLDQPSPAGAPVAAVSAGEVGTLGAREGGWVRLSFGGARAGWLPVAAVLALDAAD